MIFESQKKIYILILVLICSQFLFWPNFALAGTYYATANLYALDHANHSVANVSYNIYEQKRDYNGNYVVGNLLTSGKIDSSGHKEVAIKMSSNWNMQIAIEYYLTNKAYEKFMVWDQTVVAQESRTIYLPMSSVSVVLKQADNQLLKYFKFDVYSTVTDIFGTRTANTKLYSSQTTSNSGEKQYYFIPGNYIIRIKYPELKNVGTVDYAFNISPQKRTYLNITLSNIIVAVKNANNDWKSNANFILYKKEPILNEYAYQDIGHFNTGVYYKSLYLPIGDYRIVFQDSQGKYTKTLYFSLDFGQQKQLIYNLGTNSNIIASSSSTSANYGNSNIDADSLYELDSDNDGLADFEEYYLWQTDPFKMDSDGDGYNDKIEIAYGYNPNGAGRYTYVKFSYGKPRMKSPSMEKDLALNLKNELESRLGRSFYISSAADWITLVNAYIYGGYSIDEIKNTIVYGPGMVHPTILASQWRDR
jgi:hypothetical protein